MPDVSLAQVSHRSGPDRGRRAGRPPPGLIPGEIQRDEPEGGAGAGLRVGLAGPGTHLRPPVSRARGTMDGSRWRARAARALPPDPVRDMMTSALEGRGTRAIDKVDWGPRPVPRHSVRATAGRVAGRSKQANREAKPATRQSPAPHRSSTQDFVNAPGRWKRPWYPCRDECCVDRRTMNHGSRAPAGAPRPWAGGNRRLRPRRVGLPPATFRGPSGTQLIQIAAPKRGCQGVPKGRNMREHS